jgi:hypothetical protein
MLVKQLFNTLLDMYISNISAPYSLFESHFLWLSTGQVGRMKQGVAPYYTFGEGEPIWCYDECFG